MIRRADLSDVDRVTALALLFHAHSPWREFAFDMDASRAFAGQVIENGAVFLSQDGMCGGVLSPLYFNPAIVVAIELCWWAPSGGAELKAAFEVWAKERGAQLVQFSALNDGRLPILARLYRRQGYQPSDAAFLKRI